MKSVELKNWEKALIALAALLFLTSLVAYVTGFPLRKYIFGLETEHKQEEIGKVATLGGTLKREILGESDFKAISSGDALYVRDTIVTGNDAKATILLKDGSSIELGPRTMVKLENESRRNLLGVTYTTRVNVVSGQVTGKAATTSKNNRLTIRTRYGEYELASGTGPKLVRISGEKPFIPNAQADGNSGNMFSRLIRRLTENAQQESIPTDMDEPEPSPTPSPTPTQVASPLPLPSPSPIPSPTPSPRPSPSPSPKRAVEAWTVQILSPSPNTKFRPDKASQKIEKDIQLSWRVNSKNRRPKKRVKGAATLTLKLAQLNESGQIKKVLIDKTVTTPYETTDSINYTLSQPGNYEFQVTGAGNASSAIRFGMEGDFEGIELLQPESIDFNKNQKIKDRGRRIAKVRLSWKPFPPAKTYKLKLYDRSSGSEKVQELNVTNNEYVITRQSAAQQEMHYEVMTSLPNGFTVHSAKERFIFDFPPPDPTTPPTRSVITPQDMEAWEGGILLTWQQTGVSEGYVIEIAQDPNFSKVLIKRSVKDNFFLIHPHKEVNHYWWRVSAYARQLTSRPSRVFEFMTSGDQKP
jgi:hypothetical protein